MFSNQVRLMPHPKCFQSFSFFCRSHVLSLGRSPITLITRSRIFFPLPKCMGLTRCLEGFHSSYLWNCSGILAGSMFQEGITSLLLANRMFVSFIGSPATRLLEWCQHANLWLHWTQGEFRVLGYQ
uniref:Uncharacterized protein n=1 Tax=Pipistrellus kuhlii TaxID=59472 RepID=A0A7J8B1Q7_PIPKU|nr:hypothetical protein mPipKuh1_007664 [Pipistrellus kuhlii]